MNINKLMRVAQVASGLQTWSPKTINFSTTSAMLYDKKYWRKKWVTTDDWEKVESGNEEIPWVKGLPQEINKDKWSKEEAFKGMYDFLHILGNDVTISNKVFCEGPGYARCYKANELRRLLKKKRELGHRMHAEDLSTVTKRIKFLMKFENQVKRRGHG